MKLLIIAAALASLPLISAHGVQAHGHHVVAKRQNTASSSVARTSSASPPAATSRATTAPPAGTGIPPLSQITSGMPVPTSQPLSTTYQAGASPPIPGAPPLPTFSFVPTEWPEQDKVPQTNTPEVKEWMKELEGFNIPNLNPTADGTCVGDPAAAADAANRGWWTCGGYIRDTDIHACPDKLTWGMSFDDGPSPYTPRLLKYLSDKQLKSTFFVVGSRTVQYPDTIREEYMAEHELSVHTWSHSALTKLTNEQIVAELGWTRQAIQEVIGMTPTTMRPPYGDIDDRVRAISLAMGLVPILWTRDKQNNQFDTNDWKVAGGLVTGPQSFQAFSEILGNASSLDTGFVVLQHDLYPETVDLAVGYFLDLALNFNPKLTLKSIGNCQGWPASNLYLETTKNTTFPYPGSNAAQQASTTASERASQASATGAAQGKGDSPSGNGASGLVVARMGGTMGAAVLGLVGAMFLV